MTPRQESRDNYLKAVENGDAHFEGVPCRKVGHTLRYADKSRNCVECKKVYDETPERKKVNKEYHGRTRSGI
tara:strand:+ start:63 stop:278 length:216 start_codon:yes stop_codon:yes gene_type:complete